MRFAEILKDDTQKAAYFPTNYLMIMSTVGANRLFPYLILTTYRSTAFLVREEGRQGRLYNPSFFLQRFSLLGTIPRNDV